MIATLKFILAHPLNRKGKLPALGRYFWWQITARLLPGPKTKPFVNNSVLVMEPGMTGATGNWYCGLHEADDMAFVLRFLRQEDVFADIGANVGSYTVLAGAAVGARTLAFEPIPQTFANLKRNIDANRIGQRVTARNIGLGAEKGTLRFTSGRDTTNHVVLEDGAEASVAVPVDRFDNCCTGVVPRLIKIDVEGWEAEVLKGMPETLAHRDLIAVLAETNNSSDRYGDSGMDETAEILAQAGFRPYRYDHATNRLAPGGTAQNTIFIRDCGFVEERLKDAPEFRLVNGIL